MKGVPPIEPSMAGTVFPAAGSPVRPFPSAGLTPRPSSPAEVRPLPDGPLHFVGIGGAGQSAIAYVLAQRGRIVRGSDPGISPTAKARLESVGCEIFTTHAAENLAPDTAAVIVTDAVNAQNPEVAAALSRNLPVFRRPEALAHLVNSAKTAICVAGTHGKTTTTGMIASILIHAGLNPTVLIGGDLPLIHGNSQNGDPELVVAEACEAYGGLDCLSPTIAVITNCEPDHLDFHGSEENFYKAFERFIQSSEKLIACGDDTKTRELAWQRQDEFEDNFSRVRLYGLDEQTNRDSAQLLTSDEVLDLRLPEGANAFTILLGEEDDPDAGVSLGVVHLGAPGKHNALNAIGAASVGAMLHLSDEAIIGGLEAFTGTGRRFERLGTVGDIAVVDDYAHHPTEIRATLQAARQAYPDRRIVAIYQPHLPSRTRDFLAAFADALAGADALYLTDIYLAREPEQPGLIETLAEKSGAALVKDRFALPAQLARELKPGDVALFMGAGNIREQAEGFLNLTPISIGGNERR
jgi:UDP-N-acetylmuramate--alanine ligase